ncbi:fimbria/pilus outer membrane usher protein [Vibrio comitans]|uniref:Pilus assembly protein PapC n=1 Tax=Vibrio comitans NBRC 102076 TaxID=1219078 RepID=A0A4Y3IP08_9VIBR|nr:fimbria/pilus outer membrane usher protein [Vibrio comitans]GEA60845.1 hypothetical protein VCO01S_20380 [Vibrio comitans NBRC 102076]
MNSQWIWIFTLVLPAMVFAQSWVFPLPIYRSDILLGELNVYSDGTHFEGVVALELIPVIERMVTDSVLERLEDYGKTQITNTELAPLGLEIVFDPYDLSLDLEILADSSQEFDLSYGDEYSLPIYSQAGTLSWHNILNLSDYVDIDSGETVNYWLAEWVSRGNLFGPNGLNFDFTGYASDYQGDNTTEEIELYRGDASIFIDRSEYPFRFTAGDIQSLSIGHQPSLTLGGVAFERLYGSLQPTRNIQNGGTQSVQLSESARVIVYINDSYIDEIRLPPGRYQLDNLPLSNGDNDIRLEINYQSGRRETLNYSQFYNMRLLKAGLSDFGLYAGVDSDVQERVYHYDTEQYMLQGYYEYGFTGDLTMGLNGTYHPLGQIVGLTAIGSTQLGNIGGRLSALNYDDQGNIGGIVSVDYSTTVWGNLDFSSPNLRASVEAYTDYRSLPWETEADLYTGTQVLLAYTYRISPELYGDTGVSWMMIEDPEEIEYTGNISLTWRPDIREYGYGSIEFTAEAEYTDNSLEAEQEMEYSLYISWEWYSDDGNYDAFINYDSGAERLRAGFSRDTEYTPYSFGYDLETDLYLDYQNYLARGTYIGNRISGEIEAQHAQYSDTEFNSQQASARLSTALLLVDTDVSWSRSYSGPAVLVKVHETLDDPVLINSYQGESPESIATSSLSNTAPLYTPHSRGSIDIAVPDAPMGYDYGNSIHQVTPGAYTGHIVQVGSDATKTVIGTLFKPTGQPLILRNGVITGEGLRKVIFTNRGGRFALDGVKSGRYLLEITGEPAYVVELVIEKTESNLIYLDPITLLNKGNKL